MILLARFPTMIPVRQDAAPPDIEIPPPAAANIRVYPWFILAACLLLPLTRVVLIEQFPNPLRATALDPDALAPAGGASLGQRPLALDIDGGLRIFGYDLSRTRLPADGALEAALYLARTQPGARRLWPIFFIEDGDGLGWQDPDALPPRWQREPPSTALWPVGQYAQWARRISLAPGTPPGIYTLWGQVYDLDSRTIASVIDSTGSALAPRFELSALEVERPAQPWNLSPPTPAVHDFGPLRLLGFGIDRSALDAGGTLLLSLYWRSNTSISQDVTAQVRLISSAGPAFEMDLPPANAYPTSRWQAGDEWRGQARLRLPAGLPAGAYELSVAVPALGAGEVPLAQIDVSAPPHEYQPVPVAAANGAQFDGVGLLTGYSLTRTTESLSVSLAWQAIATPDEAYNVFIHLQENATGRIWAQSDSGPADWRRPTTGWLPGEFISDLHTLPLPPDLPAGGYTLWAGLYEPRAGGRVPVTGPGATTDLRVALVELTFP